MRHRLASGLAVAATATVVAAGLAPSAAALPPPAPDANYWCATVADPAAPCIVSVSRDGANVPDDGTYDVTVSSDSGSPGLALWSVSDTAATVPDGENNYSSLASGEVGHVWSVTMQVPMTPRMTFSYANDAGITRNDVGAGRYEVTVKGKPVRMGVNDECDTSSWPWQCPPEAGANVTAFSGEISDFSQWADAGERSDFNGMDAWTNVEASGLPPQLIGDPFTIRFDLANSHYLAGDTDPFLGFFHIVLPNAFLVDMGIDDPSTLSPAGVTASSIGTGSSAVTPGAGSTLVDVTNMTFSPHRLKLSAGVITPTTARHLVAKRTSAHRAKLTFHRAKPRGSKLTGYQARCQAKHHPTVKAKGKHTTLHLHRLAKRTAYTCQVRARSKAGYGHWSKKKHLASFVA